MRISSIPLPYTLRRGDYPAGVVLQDRFLPVVDIVTAHAGLAVAHRPFHAPAQRVIGQRVTSRAVSDQVQVLIIEVSRGHLEHRLKQ